MSDESDVISEMIEKLDNVSKDVGETKEAKDKPVPSESDEDIDINSKESKVYKDEDVSYEDYQKLDKEKQKEYDL